MKSLVFVSLLVLCSTVTFAMDTDGDGYLDVEDNCTLIANGAPEPDLRDADLDGFGNACDGDFDNNGYVTTMDFGVFLQCYQTGSGPALDPDCEGSDMDGSGVVDIDDFNNHFLPAFQAGTPGPSGLVCAGSIPCLPTAIHSDADGDNIPQLEDNCPTVANSAQDSDHDRFGNACDADLNNDNVIDAADQTILSVCMNQFVPGNGPADDPMCGESDLDASGNVTAVDQAQFDFLAGSGVVGPGLICNSKIWFSIPGLGTVYLDPCPNSGGQRADDSYLPRLEFPEYDGVTGPVVAVDTTHNNFHQITGRYTGFARLLGADGYTVEGFHTAYTTDCETNPTTCAFTQALADVDIFVISNAYADMTPGEAALIRQWLEGTLACNQSICQRSLLLIADHQDNGSPTFNFPQRIAPLSAELGVDWPNNNMRLKTFSANPVANPQRDGVLNPTSSLVLGRSAAEQVVSVTTFKGSSIVGAPGAVGAESVLTLATGAGGYDAAVQPYDASGHSQGLMLQVGSGRAYLSAEAAMFSAQVNGTNLTGMQTLPRNHNQQFLLNIMHWLDRTLN